MPTPSDGAATGAVNLLLRMEGALVLAISVLAYARLGAGWGQFALLFLIPDLFMLGYIGAGRWGALCYNTGHTYLLPALMGAVGWSMGLHGVYGLAVIWTAHIGFDRMIGFGLK